MHFESTPVDNLPSCWLKLGFVDFSSLVWGLSTFCCSRSFWVSVGRFFKRSELEWKTFFSRKQFTNFLPFTRIIFLQKTPIVWINCSYIFLRTNSKSVITIFLQTPKGNISPLQYDHWEKICRRQSRAKEQMSLILSAHSLFCKLSPFLSVTTIELKIRRNWTFELYLCWPSMIQTLVNRNNLNPSHLANFKLGQTGFNS